jgi:hypothetical protein
MTVDEMNRTFVIAAYAVMWIVVGGYFVRLWIKGSRVRADYERMAASATRGDR